MCEHLFNRPAHSAGPFLNIVFPSFSTNLWVLEKRHFRPLSAIGTGKKLQRGRFGAERIDARRNWWDPVEMRNLQVIQRFRHSLMLLAAIPHQPNAYGAISFLSKI